MYASSDSQSSDVSVCLRIQVYQTSLLKDATVKTVRNLGASHGSQRGGHVGRTDGVGCILNHPVCRSQEETLTFSTWMVC